MKITPSNTNSVVLSEEFKSVSFGIKKDGLAHIFSVLRNQLYSDKILAVIREYSANALDANIEAGNEDRLIQITSPSYHDPVFRVRDFGRGLDEDEIRDIYANYGESTKRNSNRLIGQLGLGSKAAFAHGENFVINSYVNGKKIIYNAYIDPTQIGMIAKMGEEDTDEPNGVMICVPVRINDIYLFQNKITSFFRFWNPIPEIIGLDITANLLPEPLMTSDGWEYFNPQSTDFYSVVTMGNIAYPISFDLVATEIRKVFEDKYGRTVFNAEVTLRKNFIFRSNIGDLEVSASREGLQYTDHTKKNLVSIIGNAIEQLVSKMDDSIQKCENIFEAMSLFDSYYSNLFSGYEKINFLFKDIKWNGINLSENAISFDSREMLNAPEGGMAFSLNKFYKAFRSKKKASYISTNQLLFKKNELNIIDDCNNKGLRNAINDLIMSQRKYEHICVIKIRSQAGWAAALKAKKLENYEFVKASSLVSPFQSDQRTNAGYRKNSKHLKKTFRLEMSQYSNSKCISSDYWRPVDIDIKAEGGVWIPIRRFEYIKSSDRMQTSELISNLEKICKALNVTIPNFYGFKSFPKKASSNKDLVHIKDWIEYKTIQYLTDNNQLQKFADFVKFKEFRFTNSNIWLVEYLKKSKHEEIKDNQLCQDLISEYSKLKAITEDKELSSLWDLLKTFEVLNNVSKKIEDQSSNCFIEKNKEFNNTYPVIKYLDESFFGWKNEEGFNNVFASLIK